MVVVTGFHEEEPVLQEFVRVVKILAEKRSTRFRKRAVLHFRAK